MGFAVIGIGMICAGFNLAATIINYRAPGMTWSRVPIFVWSILATSALLTLATPDARRGRTVRDPRPHGRRPRSSSTSTAAAASCGRTSSGSSATPRCTSWRCPASGSWWRSCPVFTRKPLFAYKVAAAGMIGVALLSFFVWQHHLFQSGINPDMRPLFMLTTELISIPTGFIFLVGTRARSGRRRSGSRYRCSSASAMFFNFLIGGVTGVFLSDVPVERDRARQLLRAGPLPLHDHGRPDLRLLRRPLLLAPEDDRQDA